MEHDLEYQSTVRQAIRAAAIPLPVSHSTATSSDTLDLSVFRQPHSRQYLVNGRVCPPAGVIEAIRKIHRYMSNYAGWDKRLVTVKVQPEVSPLYSLYVLWWLSGDVCGISGVRGDWQANSPFKLCFDRVVPGGSYKVENLQIILCCVNTAKWDHSDEETREWMRGYKTNSQ